MVHLDDIPEPTRTTALSDTSSDTPSDDMLMDGSPDHQRDDKSISEEYIATGAPSNTSTRETLGRRVDR